MNRNVKIAKELIRIAKNLISANGYLFPDLHDVEVEQCYMAPCFEAIAFDIDYEQIGQFEEGVYLYGNAKGKKPQEIFDMNGFNEEWIDAFGDSWKQFFSEISENLNNATYEIPLKEKYAYANVRGNLQSDWVQVIYDKSEISNPKFFEDFFYGEELFITISIDDEEYNNYDILDDLSHYSKQKVIDAFKSKLGNNFSDDIKSQLEELLPEDNKIDHIYE